MIIAAEKIARQLEEMNRNRCLLALDHETLEDARDLIIHLVERIEELENPIGPVAEKEEDE